MSTRFKPCENGWYFAHPTEAGIEAAKDHAAGQVEYVYERGADDIYLGRLSEVGFSHFMTERFVPFTMNGGFDGLPDFVIGSDHVGCSLKCRSIKTGRMRPSYVINVPESDFERAADEDRNKGGVQFFFACYEYPINRLLLLGGISFKEFASIARRVPAGAALNPVTSAGEATVSMDAKYLRPPMEWLWMLYGEKVHYAT